ncbi:MAG: thiol:disulfide interchange protein DsbA/DsbL [Steroidobacteraceae bacterium]
MRRKAWSALALVWVVAIAGAQNPQWRQGEHYFALQPPQPTNVPAGKIEVTEVFSYACPACNAFYPVFDRLRESLPANVVVNYVAAAFRPDEDWVVFQRAYYAAKALGIDKRTHDAMFDAIWKTGELATMDPQTERLKNPMPSIEDVARWYHKKTGVDTQKFLAAANSFSVNLQMRQANDYIMAAQVDGTPTVIVNGKYRLSPTSAGGYDQTIQLVKYLVKRQSK